ncbi:hypothetical protein J4436_00390 [Candidatus Woesearchaeota archaeon]|nr:hypothetical protein [Candidatus Woesearchaeota archaeon]
MEKRGQVMMFVIIGIVILIIAITVFFIQRYILKSDLERELAEHRNVPLEVLPLVESTDSCLQTIIQEAVDIVGLQGGYIDLLEEDIPTSSFSPLTKNLEILPSLKTPLWFRETPNGIQKTEVPSLEDIETNIEVYINENSQRCFNNLSYYSQFGYTIVQNKAPLSTIEIYDKNILMRVITPIEISYKEQIYPLSTFLVEMKSNLGLLYDVANEIINTEIDEYFLENMTIDMLIAYDSIVPFSGTKFDCSEDVWSKKDVINNFKDILTQNIAAIKIKNTKNNALDKYFEVDALDSSQDVFVDFMYSSLWPTTVEITPSEGDILRSDSTATSSLISRFLSSFVCINNHHFIYDIKYPVLVRIQDGNNYIFQFAIEVIIDNNQPRKNNLILEEYEQEEDKICKFSDKEITILTYYKNSFDELIPLTDVDLSFRCGTANCKLDKTKLDYYNDASLVTQVPLCFNGIVEGNKDGFFSGKSLISTNEDQSQVSVTLEQIQIKPVNVIVIDKDKGIQRDVFSSEQVIFFFTSLDNDYSINYLYPDSTIPLIPGTYEVVGFITGNSTWPIRFEKKKIETCIDVKKEGLLGIFKTEEKCFTTEIPELEMDLALKGGEIFNFTVNRYDLSRSSALNLYILAEPIPSNVEDLAQISTEIETNYLNPYFKYPDYEI